MTTLIEHHKAECNRYVNGFCSTHRCLVRGGYKEPPVDYDLATCEAHETVKALEASGWQPIETAPKDGTRVLLAAPRHLHMIGAWLEHAGYYFGPAWWSNNTTIAPPPTHWMPLLELPDGTRQS